MSGMGERLYQTVQRNDFNSALKGLESGASANYVHVDEVRVARTSVPVLYEACENQNIKLVELLLAHGADPNAEWDRNADWGSEHKPCLFAAPRSIEIARALLEGGADPNIPSVWRENYNNENSTIYVARGNPQVIALLRRYGAR